MRGLASSVRSYLARLCLLGQCSDRPFIAVRITRTHFDEASDEPVVGVCRHGGIFGQGIVKGFKTIPYCDPRSVLPSFYAPCQR